MISPQGIADIFSTSGFPPRWRCGDWSELLGWTHIVSDLLTAAAYFAIPTLILVFKARRPDVSFPTLFWLFAAFILFCGAVHLIEVTLFWHPWYRLSAVFKVAMAVVSVATTFAIIRALPTALDLPGLSALNDELVKSKAALRTVLNSSRNFIGLLNPDGVLIDANETALKFASVDAADVLGRPFSETAWWAHSPDLQIRLRAAIEKASRGAEDAFEATHPRPDGSLMYVDFSITPVLSNGKVIALVPEGADMTERRRDERALRQLNSELTRSNRELEQFGYLASHDLQEPLRTVANASNLLQSECSDAVGEVGGKALSLMDQAVTRMQRLIEDLLQHSRIGQGGDLEQVDFGKVVEELMAEMSNSIREAGGEFEVSPLPTLPARATEASLLFQNLFSNAIRFRDESRALKIHVSAQDQGAHWLFVVSDNGIGIDRAYFEKVFDVFQQLNPRGSYGGTGIGLAQCRKIVESHGGRIWCESEPGQGSTFFFEFPKSGSDDAP